MKKRNPFNIFNFKNLVAMKILFPTHAHIKPLRMLMRPNVIKIYAYSNKFVYYSNVQIYMVQNESGKNQKFMHTILNIATLPTSHICVCKSRTKHILCICVSVYIIFRGIHYHNFASLLVHIYTLSSQLRTKRCYMYAVIQMKQFYF